MIQCLICKIFNMKIKKKTEINDFLLVRKNKLEILKRYSI